MADHSVSSTNPPDGTSVPWANVERFIGLLTHDIRNGLNALELQLTYLSEISEDPEAKEEVKRIRGSVADITRHLHTVRIAAGAPTAHRFPYPASEFVEDLRERFDRQNPDAATRVQWTTNLGDGSISVDPELSMGALLELLANAVFYAEAGSTVQAHANGGPEGLALSIHERLAVPPSDSPTDWGRTPLSSSKRSGYGLGTFQARRILESQDGSLVFAVLEAGKTLVTTVSLPAATGDDEANR